MLLFAGLAVHISLVVFLFLNVCILTIIELQDCAISIVSGSWLVMCEEVFASLQSSG